MCQIRFADCLFLAALFVPAAGIVAGVIYLLIPRHPASVSRSHPVGAKAH